VVSSSNLEPSPGHNFVSLGSYPARFGGG